MAEITPDYEDLDTEIAGSSNGYDGILTRIAKENLATQKGTDNVPDWLVDLVKTQGAVRREASPSIWRSWLVLTLTISGGVLAVGLPVIFLRWLWVSLL